MIVYDFFGEKECNTMEELLDVLRKRSANNSNEFELRTEKQYPYLAMLVKDDYACVHYFSDDADCGHYAYMDKWNKDEYVTFNMGNENSETEISKDMVIDIELAIELAMDFYKNLEMSKKIEWFEL